ncbi:MAG TPA: ATP-dependent Clp protease proteolytic subunit, partial [Azoarcus taiwanensis]|nr:ATP-dependent Clp protease proteolytic subunit [Azoarcus taiwanensis]
HEGIGIHNVLRAHPARVEVIVEGVAGSAGSIVAMAGDEIVMYANALMMIHGAQAVDSWGDEIDTPEAREAVRAFNAALIETYKARTGKSDEELTAMLATDTWMAAREAVAAGFADRVEELTRAAEAPEAASAFAMLAAATGIPADVLARAEAEATTTGDDPKASEGGDPQPEPDTEDEPGADDPAEGDPADTSETFAAQVGAIAAAAGLGAHVAAWLLDAAITDVATARAAIAEASEIVALCRAVGHEDQAAGLVRDRKSLAEARAHLAEVRARADENTHTRNHVPAAGNGAAQPTSAQAVWKAALAKLPAIR